MVVAVLALFALATPTAAVAASPPATVGLVSFVGASLTPTGATLTVDWPSVAGATGYEVFVSSSYDGVATVKTPAVRPTDSKALIPGLKRGTDYFVQVRAVSAAGVGGRSSRVGHSTITAQATPATTAPTYSVMTWNVCSYACSSLSTRTTAINSRIVELQPDIVALQEASRFTTAPTGYRFAVNGQNDILLRLGQFMVVPKATAATTGSAVFPRKSTTPGKGVAWAAVRHRTGAYALVFDVHFVTGTSSAQVTQREYEATRLISFIVATRNAMQKAYGSLTNWTYAPIIITGDLNTHKSRPGDGTMAVLENYGWSDAYDEAKVLRCQHCNSANPTMQSAPVIGIKWGDHVDKLLVRPGRSVVHSWGNAGRQVSGKFTPLGSDHHPVLVTLTLI